MKADIHPKYRLITVQFPKGDSFETGSTYSEAKLFLDVDYRKHPAWTKKGVIAANASNAKVSQFNKKFGSFDFSSSGVKNPVVSDDTTDDSQE